MWFIIGMILSGIIFAYSAIAYYNSTSLEESIEQPPIIMQAPSLGNLKERAMELSNSIMNDLYFRGWPRRDPRMSNMFSNRMPPLKDMVARNQWYKNVSDSFRFRHLNNVISLRNEFAQLNYKEPDLDMELKECGAFEDEKGRLVVNNQPAYHDVIPAIAIDGIAQCLIVLANKLN